jgi:hypothetical protein
LSAVHGRCCAGSISRFLAAFDFQANIPNDPVFAAIEYLRTMDRDGARALSKRPPSSFLPPQWRKLIFAERTAARAVPWRSYIRTVLPNSSRKEQRT